VYSIDCFKGHTKAINISVFVYKELYHTRDEELYHTRDKELYHTRDEELYHTRDEELYHTRDEELYHTRDEERYHNEVVLSFKVFLFFIPFTIYRLDIHESKAHHILRLYIRFFTQMAPRTRAAIQAPYTVCRITYTRCHGYVVDACFHINRHNLQERSDVISSLSFFRRRHHRYHHQHRRRHHQHNLH